MGGPTPKKPQLPDWDPAGPKDKVKPRTFDQKVADDLRDIEAAKKRDQETLERWRKEAEQKVKEQQEKERIYGDQWRDRRTRCAGSLGILSNQVKIRKNNWWNVAIDVSFAYESAYTSLTGILDRKNAQDQFLFNLAFNALGAVCSGGLSVIFSKAGEKWLKQGASQLWIDAAEDAVQTGVEGILTNIVPPLASDASKYDAATIPSPFKLKGELEKLLNDMESDMLGWCIARQTEINNLPLSEFEDYDPAKLDNEIAKFLDEKDKQFNSQPLLAPGRSKTDLAAELEKLMIGMWSASFLETQLNNRVIKRHLPDEIIDRLVDFGFVSDSGHFSDSDVLKVAHWGPNTERTYRRVVNTVRAYQGKKFG
jgi:hypothetical protein